MNTMKPSTLRVLELLQTRNPGKTKFYRKDINIIAEELKLEGSEYPHELVTAEFKIHKGFYDFSKLINPQPITPSEVPVVVDVPQAPVMTFTATSEANSEQGFVPEEDPHYIRWGHYNDVRAIIKRKNFCPVYIPGMSGNGKSVMIEQACAETKREYFRVQISPETDEDDLLGGFRLINGQTIFAKGPVIKAMERGAVLNLDEMDRGTNKIMCLQGVMEGKPILIKKTGEIVRPAHGFTVFCTANTKGKGSDDGRYTAASVIDDAFLERFPITLDQPYPSLAIEKKIVMAHMDKYGKIDEDFADLLVKWSETIRQTFEKDGIDEIISTRRLCHITQAWSIFDDRMKAIDICTSRFGVDTKTAFVDFYKKIDASATAAKRPIATASKPAPQSNKIPW